MKLNRVKITNFKRFHDFEIVLDGKSLILFGVNGIGKSSFLSAVSYLNRVWINRINPSQSKSFESFDDDQILSGKDSLSIEGVIQLDDEEYQLKRMYRRSVKNSRAKTLSYDKKEYDRMVFDFTQKYLSSDDTGLPIFVYYGTNRSVLNIPLRIKTKHHFDKLSSIDHAMENSADFLTFFEWYRYQESDESTMIRELNDLDYSDKMLKNVRYVIEEMIDNVSDLRVKINPLRMVVTKDNKELRVDLLSDGEKCTLAMLGDLSRRLVLANPDSDKPLEGDGIVLIDEIELHMHPQWQRRVLPTLRKLFPNIQFIITTHSPQVLGEVDDSYRICLLSDNNDGGITLDRMDGFDSNFILEEFMNTESTNKNTTQIISDIYRLTDIHNYSEAELKLDELRKRTGTDNEEYILAAGYLLKGKITNDKNNQSK